jgi:hypothetical protein
VFVTERLTTLYAGSWFWTVNVQVKLPPGNTDVGQVFERARPDVFGIGVGVGVGVGGTVGVFVGVLVGVLVGEPVGVGEGVGVAVNPGVGVIAGVGVQAKTLGEFVVLADTGRPKCKSVPLAATLSVMKVSLPLQGGAVSIRLPVQVSVPLPFGPSAVTGLPFWLQGAAEVVPSG